MSLFINVSMKQHIRRVSGDSHISQSKIKPQFRNTADIQFLAMERGQKKQHEKLWSRTVLARKSSILKDRQYII